MDVWFATLIPGTWDTDTEIHREWELISAARKDPQAFAPLYESYLPRINRYIRTRVSSDEDAADVTQQVFLNALQALPRYRFKGIPFSAWLFRIAQLTLKQKRRKDKSSVSWDLLPVESYLEGELDPEDIVLQQEGLQRLRRLLARLSPEKRDLLALRFAAGLSSSEIAAVVGKNTEAVKKQLSRIIHTLKEEYHDA
ncbi:sigma-70 family RNA polymerase sigma factor [Ktedonosporobacter rubrisoli]|uniref:Sigma-70 family RNA polymerase sigma factor n=1 Tax=Ktedonosporobacter rubrisoli TaxID=2509675 RepID=A0A4P6JX10_KTERU|nr:sigma-70 family RNA polymerase sigma factor [Ktedonosporobacter rubrisoli]QBD80269.1 sigma-70 family RNA polymerase sigma factor [Ktedonosporobacter rubrisoli]